MCGDGPGFDLRWEVPPVIAVGIDIAKRTHEACFLSPDGQELGKPLRFRNDRPGVQALLARVQQLPEAATIGLEATGHYWLALYDALVQAGLSVQVLNPLQTHAYRRTTVRKVKNDRKDAWLIADVVRIGRGRAAYVPDETICQLRELTRFRWSLVDQVGDAKRRVLTVLDRVFPEFAAHVSDPFGASGRELLGRAASAADFAALELGEVTALLERASRKRLGRAQADALHQAAADSLGVAALGPAAAVEVRALLAQRTLLEEQIATVDAAIGAVMATIEQHLTSIPGVGPVLAATILAELGDVGRFERLEAVVAYAGLDPSVCESGQFQGRRGHISKRGSPYLRRALFLAAHSAQLHNADLRAYLAASAMV
jgi:transposase